MIHVYYLGLAFLALCAGFRLGWSKGIDDTLEYFTKHPIPDELLEKK